VPGDGVQVFVLLELDRCKGCTAAITELLGELCVLRFVREIWDVALRLFWDVKSEVLEPPAEM